MCAVSHWNQMATLSQLGCSQRGCLLEVDMETREWPKCHTNHSVCLKPAAVTVGKQGVRNFHFKMKRAKLDRLTYSTNDLFTLSDARGFEHHTAEPCWRRGFWGVSVVRANGMHGSCRTWTNHITLAYYITVCRGVPYTSSRVIVNHPHRRKAAACCV